MSAPLAAAAATSGAEAVDAAATEDVVAEATGDSGGLMVEATDLLASFTAELSDANAAASGGGCCRSGLLESSDIAEETERHRAGARERANAPVLLFIFFALFLFPFF